MGGFMTDKPRERAASLASLALALWLLSVSPATADTFKPTRFDDPPPGKCKPDDCSLREAIGAANDPGSNKVVLAKGTYEIQIPVTGGDLSNDAGDFNVTGQVEIRGQGPTETKVDGNGLDRVFSFTGFAGKTARSLTVKGGDAGAVPAHSSQGGGIIAGDGQLTLRDVVVRKNEAQFGGGIESYEYQLTIRDSTIAQNAAGEGGGVHLMAYFDDPATTIRSSTISANSAGKGGGILAEGYHANPNLDVPVLSVVTSTIAGNYTSAEGGGIMADNGASVTLGGSTVAYNTADVDNTGGGVGGGIHQHSGATFVFADSVLASNQVGSSGTDPQCNGSFSSNPGGVIEVQPAPCLLTGSPALVGGAQIEALADNGGATKTIKLQSSSPAIGRSVECAKRDQRGVKRPAVGCDSGAYERKGP